MRKKNIVCLMAICVTLIIIISVMYIKSEKYKCYRLERAIEKELGVKSLLSVQEEKNGTIIIFYDNNDLQKLYEIQKVLNVMLEEDDFWIAKEKRIYEIQLAGEHRWFGGREIASKITNANPINANDYTVKGIYMKLRDEMNLSYDNYFEDVYYMMASGYRLVDYSSLVYFPNLTYLDLANKRMSQELFDHIKSIIPENCEIVNYFVDLDNCETEKRKANWY